MTASRERSGKWIRGGAWALVALPATLLGLQAATSGLGANPVEAITHVTGEWALRFLILSLAITPLRRFGLAILAPTRRTFGLAAFGYAAAHFTTYLTLDLGFDFGFLAEDVLERPYIAVGFASLLILTALAVTSTRAWQRRLGRKWVTLHRAVYAAAALAALHFIWLVKADLTEPAIYAALIAVLLAARALPARGARRRGKCADAPAAEARN